MPSYTEDEARGKWCPFARSVAPVDYGYRDRVGNPILQAAPHNRDNPNGSIPACIASSCMAWRWESEKPLKDIDLVNSEVVEIKPRLGYCGLCGKPEWGI
jgi:hypothetical protein